MISEFFRLSSNKRAQKFRKLSQICTKVSLEAGGSEAACGSTARNQDK
jgi:hypothetical protein